MGRKRIDGEVRIRILACPETRKCDLEKICRPTKRARSSAMT